MRSCAYLLVDLSAHWLYRVAREGEMGKKRVVLVRLVQEPVREHNVKVRLLQEPAVTLKTITVKVSR